MGRTAVSADWNLAAAVRTTSCVHWESAYPLTVWAEVEAATARRRATARVRNMRGRAGRRELACEEFDRAMLWSHPQRIRIADAGLSACPNSPLMVVGVPTRKSGPGLCCMENILGNVSGQPPRPARACTKC